MADTRTETPADDACSRCGSTFEHLHLFEGRPGQFCRDCAVELLTPGKTRTPADEMREAVIRLREHLVPAVTARVIEHTAIVAVCGNHDPSAQTCLHCQLFDVQDRVLARLVATLINAREPLASWLEEYVRWANDSITDYEEGNGPVHESEYCDGEIGKGCQCFAHPLAVARVLDGGVS